MKKMKKNKKGINEIINYGDEKKRKPRNWVFKEDERKIGQKMNRLMEGILFSIGT